MENFDAHKARRLKLLLSVSAGKPLLPGEIQRVLRAHLGRLGAMLARAVDVRKDVEKLGDATDEEKQRAALTERDVERRHAELKQRLGGMKFDAK